MTDIESYFIKGYLLKTFRAGSSLNRLNEVFRELRAGDPKPPFRWEEKYAFSADLRPNVFAYDDVFLDILFENGIPELLRSLTGIDMQLAHLQLRHAFKGESYMDWHRDTHFYGGDIHGNTPPVHKVIFYPAEGAAPHLRLKVSPGSQLRYLPKAIDTLQARFLKADRILSSDASFLVFNTCILHAAAAEQDPKGAYRLIYSFCNEGQVALFKDQADLQDAWRRRLSAAALPAAAR